MSGFPAVNLRRRFGTGNRLKSKAAVTVPKLTLIDTTVAEKKSGDVPT